jgi:rare lipoprotein A
MQQFPGYLAALLALAAMGALPPPPDASNQKVPPASAVSRQSSPKVQTRLTAPEKRAPKPYQVGTASWYGRYFHGRPTASGEPYDMFRLTAAHRTLKFGTWVRVTNLRNGKSILVRINDRGPVPPSRIIDLSFEAATQLGARARGLEKVRLDIVKPEIVATELNLQRLP